MLILKKTTVITIVFTVQNVKMLNLVNIYAMAETQQLHLIAIYWDFGLHLTCPPCLPRFNYKATLTADAVYCPQQPIIYG